MKTNYLTHTKKKLSFTIGSYFFSIKLLRKVGNKEDEKSIIRFVHDGQHRNACSLRKLTGQRI